MILHENAARLYPRSARRPSMRWCSRLELSHYNRVWQNRSLRRAKPPAIRAAERPTRKLTAEVTLRPRTALQGLVFVAAVFFALPRLFISFGQAWGWPVLEGSALPALGGGLIAVGVAISLYCSNLFRQLGHGTPVPSEPPTELVTSGLYAHSRNPIYVADLVILFGIFLLRGHLSLFLYAALFFAAIEAWLILHEEPVLRKRFGAPYEAYACRVPRWMGRVTAT